MIENNKIIGYPSVLQIGFSFFGMLFSSAIAYLIYNSKSKINNQNDNIIIWILISIFCVFSLASLYMLLSSKKVELTNETLSISYPYIFRTKKIDFNEVVKVVESNYKVESSHNFSTFDIYNGQKITIEFSQSKKIEITSLEVSNYNLLATNLKNITKPYFKLRIENRNLRNTSGFGWLIFIALLTLGLVISLIKEH